jgi:hypothetical protein
MHRQLDMANPVDPVYPEQVVTSSEVITDFERSTIASPIGWSSIFGATAVAIGVWLVLHLFGVGAGLTALDPDDPSTLRSVGIGVGVWGLIAPLIALFIGGLVAGRVAPTINTLNAVIHGAVVWALTALAALVLVVMTAAAMTRGAVATGKAVSGAAGHVVSQAEGVSLSTLGLRPDDLVAPINQRLQAEGKPPVPAKQLADAAQAALRESVRQGGQIDRQQLVNIVAQRTNLSRSDAEAVAAEIETKWNDVKGQTGQMMSDVRRGAMQVAETTGKVLLTLSITMLIGLGLAILGAFLSVRHERREHVVLPRMMTR